MAIFRQLCNLRLGTHESLRIYQPLKDGSKQKMYKTKQAKKYLT